MQTHHAYVLEGPLSLLGALAADARELFGFDAATDTHNPDVSVRQWEKFGIDESRELSQAASLRSLGGIALFVLGIASITSEAQQALLKLFEEPQAGVVFVLLAPHGVLLPTLRSRFALYPRNVEVPASTVGQAADFLSSTYAKRSEWIMKFLKEDDDGLRERVRDFVNALEAELYPRLQGAPLGGKGAIRDALQDIGHFRQYLSDRAPSLKMILEHFAITFPQL